MRRTPPKGLSALPYHKNLYERIQYESSRPSAVLERPQKGGVLAGLLCCAVPGLFLLAFQLLKHNRGVMDAVVFGFTTPLKHVLSRLNSHLPFAAGEAVWGVGLLALAVFLLRTVWLLVTREGRLRRLLRRGLAALAAGLIIYSCYTLMWGCNYYATPFTERAELTPRYSTVEELYQLTAAFGRKCGQLSGQVPRNEAGVMETDHEELFENSALLYRGIAKEFPVLAVERHDPKPMFFSRLLSLTGFSGFYFPMTAESIVNVDQADCMIPATILHELAHQCNVAEEDAANFVAILAGVRSEDVEFQYSSALMGYIHTSNALRRADRDLYDTVSAGLNEQVLADLADNDAYWAQFETPVADASQTIYNGFLHSYGHSEGVKSYGMCVDLLSAYYFDR